MKFPEPGAKPKEKEPGLMHYLAFSIGLWRLTNRSAFLIGFLGVGLAMAQLEPPSAPSVSETEPPAPLTIPVRLTAGGRDQLVQAERLSFDGVQYRLRSAGQPELACPPEQIRHFEIDMKPANDTIRNLTAEAGRLRSDQARSMSATQSGASAFTEMQEALRRAAAEKEQHQQDLRRLTAENSILQSQLAESSLTLAAKTREISAREAEIASLRQPLAQRTDLFSIVNPRWTPAATSGLVDVTGEVKNGSERAVETLLLDVAVVDETGQILAVGSAFVTNLYPGETRAFQTDIEADTARIQLVRVAVAGIFEESPVE